MKRVIVYNDEIHAPALVIGDRVEVIRGNGPREGELMWFAVIKEGEAGGLEVVPLGEFIGD
jgi:uncharacterized protein (DUF362 family)